jgi:chromosome segregation ATPase
LLQTFVEGKRLSSTVDRTLQEFKRATEAYKKQVVDPKDTEELKKAEAVLNETNSRWKPMSSDLKSCQGTLDKAQKNWKKYSAALDEFEDYLPQAEQALNASPEERAVSDGFSLQQRGQGSWFGCVPGVCPIASDVRAVSD